MRSVALTLLAALVSASVGHGDVGEPPCLVPLGPPEGIGRWSDEAPILSDPEQGPVVSVPLAAGTSFRSLELPVEFGPFEEEDALQFWWRSEGEGLRSFYIKVRSAPLAGGMEAVYVVWEPQLGPPPTEWTFVRLPLRRPRWDDWGERPVLDRRYLTLRVSGDQQARGAVLLADLELFRPCVTLRPDPVPPGDYAETIGGTVHNRTDRPLAVELGTGDRLLQTIALLPNETRRWEAPNPVDRSTWEKARPLHRWSVPVWIRLTGHPQTQTSQEIVQMKGLQLAEHPRLLLNSEGIARLNERLETTPEGQRYREQLLRRAEERLEEPVILPPRGGNWWHYYTSPETGAALRTGRKIGEWQWEHIDPVTGKTYRGDPSNPATDYDGVVIAGVHNGWARAIRDLGLAYHVTGNAAYADKAREILLAYAEAYLSYPLHTIRGEPRIGGGRVGPQTLDEATWLIPVAQGADLIWSRLSESERNRLAERLFQPAVREVILPHKQGVHNIQCWKNSAIGLVGFLLGDLELIGEAIENPERGYRRQMEGGVSPDGVWWEGAWGYHFYTLSALWPLTEAAQNNGLNLYGDPLKRMYDAPLRFAMPNDRLPAFNDSREVNLHGQRALYELAYARYRDPAYLSLLASGPRESELAVWFGEPRLPEPPERRWSSANYPDSGYGILSFGTGTSATWLCLKYGPHGGGHGHPDKLNFVLYADGGLIAPDPGTARYGHPLQGGWYRATVAHNTLVVDEENQQPATGRDLLFETTPEYTLLRADAGEIHPEVRFQRTVALIGAHTIVIEDVVRSEEEHRYDIAYHQLGEWVELPAGDPWSPPERPGYRYFRDATVRQASGGELVVLRGRVEEDRYATVSLLAEEPTEVITATGIGEHLEDRVPLVLFRRRARSTRYLWAISLDFRPVELKRAPDDSVLIVTPEGASWRFSDGSLERQAEPTE